MRREALALPGVHCVLTAKDIPGLNAGRYPDYPVMAEDVVVDIGDAVALVAADTRDLAEEAASLVRVAYEPLPGAYDFAWHSKKARSSATGRRTRETWKPASPRRT